MENTLSKKHIETLVQGISFEPALKASSHIISLTSNQLADVSLKVSKYIRNKLPLDQLLDYVTSLLGEAGIAERILLFQINKENTQALLTHHWESPYIPRFNPVGFQLDLHDIPLFKLFHLNKCHTLQMEDISKYMTLPNYLFRNKFKSLFFKLKTKSLLINIGSSQKVRVALSMQCCTREAVWSNEIEKLIQSIVDQLTVAIEQSVDKKKKESLQKNLLLLQEQAIREQEELIRQFANNIHDLPCTIIPNLKQAIRNKDLLECENLVDELHKNLRQLINEYIIPDISILGFGSSIFQFINGLRKSTKEKIILNFPDEEINLQGKKAIELFKVFKEWFCNIHKHALASEVFFTIQKLNENYILISISDNGVGFDINNSKNIGYGLLNIKKRLSEINSKYEIKSEVNKGTSIKIQVCIN